jgi:hypothetical protein
MPSATACSAPECSPHNPGRSSPHLPPSRCLCFECFSATQRLLGASRIALHSVKCAKYRPGSVLSRAGKRLNICVPVRHRTVPPHSIQLKWLYIFHRGVVTLAKNRRFPSRFGSATRMSKYQCIRALVETPPISSPWTSIYPTWMASMSSNENHSLFRSFLTVCERDFVRSMAM